jgi:hypothetical protein
VPDLLQKNGCKAESILTQLKGIDEQVKVYKVTRTD